MEIIDKLMLNDNEVVGLMDHAGTLENYIETYMGIDDHEELAAYVNHHAAHQVIFEAETGQYINYISSLKESFLMGFIMGFNFRDRNGKKE